MAATILSLSSEAFPELLLRGSGYVADQFALNPIEALDQEPDFHEDLFIAEG